MLQQEMDGDAAAFRKITPNAGTVRLLVVRAVAVVQGMDG